jgi:hypothetical protein
MANTAAETDLYLCMVTRLIKLLERVSATSLQQGSGLSAQTLLKNGKTVALTPSRADFYNP